jgi:hypothetical protein
MCDSIFAVGVERTSRCEDRRGGHTALASAAVCNVRNRHSVLHRLRALVRLLIGEEHDVVGQRPRRGGSAERECAVEESVEDFKMSRVAVRCFDHFDVFIEKLRCEPGWVC